MPNNRCDLPLTIATLTVLACNFGRAGTVVAPNSTTPGALVGTPASTTPGALVGTPAEPQFATPTPPPNPGTLVEAVADGQQLSHPDFYWRLTLPPDWEVTYDRGFELHARGPDEMASLRLLALVWATPEERPLTSHDFVEYWRNYRYGDVFPVYANGELVSETETSAEKFGGPYLQFVFDDPEADARYVQVYASGGGPSSIVLTLWSTRSAFQQLEPEFQGIVESLAVVEAP